MNSSCCGCGEQLILLSAVLSFQIAQGRTADELALLSALFTVMGDNLALLATTKGDCAPANSSPAQSPNPSRT